jgi:hypothetical protein
MQASEVTSTMTVIGSCSHAIGNVQAMIPSRPSESGSFTDRPIAVVFDLCLYRVVTDKCCRLACDR